MAFLSLLKVATMPILQVLILSLVGVFLATDYVNILPAPARNSLNKIVFMVFTPSLVFSSLAKTVTFQDIISWWFMPVNIGITFLVGSIFGWIAVKIVRPKPYIGDLMIAMCSAGNLGNILLIIIPAICKEDGNPFGDKTVCSDVGLSYVSFSMALGAFYIWTYTYHLVRRAGTKREAMIASEEEEATIAIEDECSKEPNKDLEANAKSLLLNPTKHVQISSIEENNSSATLQQNVEVKNDTAWTQICSVLHQILEELRTPAVIAGVIGLLFGAVSWLHNLIIGENAPLRVINDSIVVLGDATIACIILILGGNLTQVLYKAKVRYTEVIAVICVRYVILPAVGICVVKAATLFGFLPSDPLYHFVLMIQFTIPPAMSIGTMAQLFGVAQEECSVLFLWTYLIAALALTGWSTVFLWILA